MERLRVRWGLIGILVMFSLMSISCGGGGVSGSTGVGGVGTGGGGGTGGVTSTTTGPTVLVVLENHSYSTMVNSPSMPYLNGLASKFSIADNYFAVTHPSIGNYFMLTTGQILTNDDNFTGTVTVDNLVREVVAAKKNWRVYAQGLPSTGYTGGDSGAYLKRHNPFSYFSDVVNDSTQANNMVPLSQLSADLSGTTLPDFMFVLPDAQHDMHDCPVGMSTCTDDDKMLAADSWLRGNIDPILNNTVFQNNGVLIVTVDESVDTDVANGGGHVMTVVAGPSAKSSFRSATFFQHQSTERLICDRLKLTVCPGAGTDATTLGQLTK